MSTVDRQPMRDRRESSPDGLPSVVPLRYELLTPIGRGSYGYVYAAQDVRDPDRKVAVKKVRMSEASIVELDVMCRIDHPYIMRCYEFYIQEDYLYYVMPLADMTLRHYLSTGPLYVTRVRLMYEMASAVEFLHSQGMYHGDIFSRNVLIKCGRAILIDMGLAGYIEEQVGATVYPFLTDDPPGPLQCDKTRATSGQLFRQSPLVVGSLQSVDLAGLIQSHSAPTVLLSQPADRVMVKGPPVHTNPLLHRTDHSALHCPAHSGVNTRYCDIWALGWLFIEILTGIGLHHNNKPMRDTVIEAYNCRHNFVIPDQWRDEINSMISIYMKERVHTVGSILSHPEFSRFDAGLVSVPLPLPGWGALSHGSWVPDGTTRIGRLAELPEQGPAGLTTSPLPISGLGSGDQRAIWVSDSDPVSPSTPPAESGPLMSPALVSAIRMTVAKFMQMTPRIRATPACVHLTVDLFYRVCNVRYTSTEVPSNLWAILVTCCSMAHMILHIGTPDMVVELLSDHTRGSRDDPGCDIRAVVVDLNGILYPNNAYTSGSDDQDLLDVERYLGTPFTRRRVKVECT